MRKLWQVWVVGAACAGLLAAAGAQAARPPRVHALVGGRIVVAPGKVIESGTVVLRDGVITAVGAKVDIPADARVWDVKGRTIYPGLVEAYSVRAWPQGKEGDKQPQGALPNTQLHPERDMTAWAVDDAAARRLREAGFGAALVAPRDGILRGASVVALLGDGSAAQSLLRRGVAQHAALRSLGRREAGGGGYPVSTMGAIALFRQTLLDAAWYSKAQAAFARNPAQERPAAEPALATLSRVAGGDDLIVFETEDVLDTLRVAKVVREFKLHAMVVGNGEEYKRLDSVRQTGLATILPVAFPKPPKIEGDGDATTDLEALRHWDAAPDNPRLLMGTGLPVALTTFRLDDPRKLFENLALSIQRGLRPEQALAALTTTPAQLLGLANRLGTIETGKIANLVVVEGDLFVAKPKLREVWVDGNRYKLESHDAKAAATEVDPAGSWELTVKTSDGQELSVVLDIAGKAGRLTGTIGAMGGKVPLQSVELSGSTLDVEFDGGHMGAPGTFSFSLDLDGDHASGSGSSPRGTFDLDGTRTDKPAAAAPPATGAAGAAGTIGAGGAAGDAGDAGAMDSTDATGGAKAPEVRQ